MPVAPSEPLQGAQVTLRPPRPEDAGVLLAIRREPAVRRWWGEVTPEEMAERVEGRHDEAVRLAICLGDLVIGLIQFAEEDDPEYRHAGIDVFVGTAHQGRGLGTDAVRTLARWLFDERGHHRLTIDPAADNHAAIRCYEKVGFRPVGVLRRYQRRGDGSFADGLLMDLLPEELT